MSVQTRTDAVQGEYVRLYCQFFRDGVLADPAFPPSVQIVTEAHHTESSSSSEDFSTSSMESSASSSSSYELHASGYGPFTAIREGMGIWYVDWSVPSDLPTGDYFDVWTYQWSGETRQGKIVLQFSVFAEKQLIDYVSQPMVSKISDTMTGLIVDLANGFIHEACHIPIHWEQCRRMGGNQKTLTATFGNWRQEPKPLLKKNKNILLSGWNTDYNGKIRLDRPYDPEDQFSIDYQFSYFSNEELMEFINLGLYAMNSVPPASQTYYDIGSAPFAWKAAILAYAAQQALRRILFGFCYQEKAIIYAEKPDGLSAYIGIIQGLYKDYQEIWSTMSKDVKSKRLPATAAIVVPSYTLPGGRSRWFRYLYKSGM